MTISCNENFQLDGVANIASPKGDCMGYVQKLKDKMIEQGADENYIELCVSYAQKLCSNSVPVIFDFKHLSLLLGYEPSELAFYLFAPEDSFYTQMKIPKKSGGMREIEIPSDKLKSIQRWILRNVLENIEVHEACYGFTKGKSIYDNALLHVGKECVLNMDLKDFFHLSRKKMCLIYFIKRDIQRGYRIIWPNC